MTRVRVQRGGSGAAASSSTPNRQPPGSQQQPPAPSKEEEQEREFLLDSSGLDTLVQHPAGAEEILLEGSQSQATAVLSGSEDAEKGGSCDDEGNDNAILTTELTGCQSGDCSEVINDPVGSGIGSSPIVTGGSYPPPPPVPPPKPSAVSSSRRVVTESSNAGRISATASRRPSTWPMVPARSSPTGSRPSSPRAYGDGDGYNSSDEHNTCFVSSYDDVERERLFELEIRRVKGLEVKRMIGDGNCLFRAVADQVYGDPEAYDMARQMCVDYMERERDHFSQFITEGFTSYCKRKRRDKAYGNNAEIQAFSEMYNRPIHIYSYSTEPINIFHGNYTTDTPPIRLSFHQGNHYNSLVDPRRETIGAGLGLNTLRGGNIDKDQVKAAIKAHQDQQIDNALLAEARFYSDVELTEKEIERMVMEASRAEYLAEDRLRQQLLSSETSTSGSEPSSSGARTGPCGSHRVQDKPLVSDTVLSGSMQTLLAMGFGYLQVIEAYTIFGDDVDSMICYLLEMESSRAPSGSSQHKGKAAE
ncbi:putative ubiquitinyl hydrolase 1 [Dioscorea sansibarensis]